MLISGMTEKELTSIGITEMIPRQNLLRRIHELTKYEIDPDVPVFRNIHIIFIT